MVFLFLNMCDTICHNMQKEPVRLFRIEDIPELKKAELNESSLQAIIKKLKETIVGQDKAIKEIARILLRADAGVNDLRQPLGSVLLHGPTGVGKTATARAVAKLWFGDPYDRRIIVLNMSEFLEPHSIYKIIGSPPGYVGAGERSLLPHDIINTGRTIVVFDEIEKAHQRIIQALLGALSEGKMSARNGNIGAEDLNFNQSLFVFTSNAGSADLARARNSRELGFGLAPKTSPDLNKIGNNAIKRIFQPEFLGRVDQIMFQPLSPGSHLKILELFVDELNSRVLTSHSTHVSLTKAAKYLLIKKAGSAEYGGRAIKSQFNRDIATALSDFLATGQINGNNSLVVDAVGNKYVYRILPTTNLKTKTN